MTLYNFIAAGFLGFMLIAGVLAYYVHILDKHLSRLEKRYNDLMQSHLSLNEHVSRVFRNQLSLGDSVSALCDRRATEERSIIDLVHRRR